MMNRVVAAIALLVMPVAAVSGCSNGAQTPVVVNNRVAQRR